MDIRKYFTLTSPSSKTSSTALPNDDNKSSGETYSDYGIRICGKVNASLPALSAFLGRIYNAERQRQANDETLQDQLKRQFIDQLAGVAKDLNDKRAASQNEQTSIECLKDNLNDRENDKIKVMAKDGELNKMAKIKLILGCILLSLLTVYLFLFYSSTFYSAFLLNPNDLIDGDYGLGTAMFNTKALSLAYESGFGALVFILSAPIIFMGLGFSLHFFMVQKSMIKWFKIVGLLFVTLMFDCILAYKIGEMLYNLRAMSQYNTPA